MSLPPLLRHIYNNGTDEVIRRGKKIFHTSGVSLLDFDHLIEQVRFRVRNDQYNNFYSVTVNKFLNTENLNVRCQCPYNLGEICRHEVAALFQLNDMIQSGFFENNNVSFSQAHTVVRLRAVNEHSLEIYAAPEITEKATALVKDDKVTITLAKDDKIEGTVKEGKQTRKVAIKQNDERYFDTACNCDEDRYPLCKHKMAVFLKMIQQHGAGYFNTMRNWDEQKNKLLSLYGYTLRDDLTNKFAFTYENGKPFLRVLDNTIKKISAAERQQFTASAVTAPVERKHLGLVFAANKKWYPHISIQLVAGNLSKDGKSFEGGLEALELNQYVNIQQFFDEERTLIPIARKFAPEEILKYLRKSMPFGDFLDDYEAVLKPDPGKEVRQHVWDYLLPKFKKLIQKYQQFPRIFVTEDRITDLQKLEPAVLSDQELKPALLVSSGKGDRTIYLRWELDGKMVSAQDVSFLADGIARYDQQLYTILSTEAVEMHRMFSEDGKLTLGKEEWNDFLSDKLLPWSRSFNVKFPADLLIKESKEKPDLILQLFERENSLVLKPTFKYGKTEIPWGYTGSVMETKGDKIKVTKRNDAEEHKLLQLLQHLHTDMMVNHADHFFFLNANHVLANNWFFHFNDIVREHNIKLLGLTSLQNLRINEHKPKTKISVTSGIDWFDTRSS